MTITEAIRKIKYGLEMETTTDVRPQLTVVRTEALEMALAALKAQQEKEVAATNYEYLRKLEHYEMANAILNIGEDPCQCCPRDKENRCNEDCNNGLVEWLASPVNPNAPVWTEH